MLPPVPSLSDYGISPENGFLPPETPVEVLSDSYYAKWEAVIANLQALLLSRRLRHTIDNLPVLSTRYLKTQAEWRRAYVVLVFMLHGYIWGGDEPAERVPPPITIPLLRVCDYLEVPPVATYAGVCLWNWRPIFPDEPADILENLACLNTLTGSMDEQWFYLISIAIEAQGASTLPVMLDAIAAARLGDSRTVTHSLQILAERLDEIGSILLRMYEHCDPHVFYHRVRPFLAGSKNMGDAGLPHGVIYDDGSGSDEYRQYGGGSNAQSSLIQFFDIVLGIEHRPTGVTRSSPPTQPADGAAPPARHGFIQEMRQYMPGPHRRFLEHVSSVANIRQFVESRRFDRELCIAYDACLAMLRALRDKHIQIVSRYIVVKSQESRAHAKSLSSTGGSSGGESLPSAATSAHATIPVTPIKPNNKTSTRPEPDTAKGTNPSRPTPTNLATASAKKTQKAGNLRGTGGTALIPFLKQARDETGEPAIDAWARRVLSNGPAIGGGGGASKIIPAPPPPASLLATDPTLAAFLGKVDEHADGQMEVVGLAGTWRMDDSEGGICHW